MARRVLGEILEAHQGISGPISGDFAERQGQSAVGIEGADADDLEVRSHDALERRFECRGTRIVPRQRRPGGDAGMFLEIGYQGRLVIAVVSKNDDEFDQNDRGYDYQQDAAGQAVAISPSQHTPPVHGFAGFLGFGSH